MFAIFKIVSNLLLISCAVVFDNCVTSFGEQFVCQTGFLKCDNKLEGLAFNLGHVDNKTGRVITLI
jgi:hypothetical protein